MTAIPDFTTLAFAGSTRPTQAELPTGEAWQTPEDIPVKPLYTAADRDGLPFVETLPGIAPYLRGPYPTMYVNQPGRSGNMPASPRPRIPTPSTGATSPPGRRGSRSPSTSPPIAAMTATIRASAAMSAWPASRSTRSTTCAPCSPASRSTR
ncbi:hypothetical protein BOSEA1005_12650 [Hyphomicrobiales bacterium]|nr:hypothetical protein BOSEA1005_12650 [Hyphomicrobiales bacterium]